MESGDKLDRSELEWVEPSKMLPVSQGHSTGTIHSYGILMELSYLNNQPGSVPASWMIANKVLYIHMVTNL